MIVPPRPQHEPAQEQTAMSRCCSFRSLVGAAREPTRPSVRLRCGWRKPSASRDPCAFPARDETRFPTACGPRCAASLRPVLPAFSPVRRARDRRAAPPARRAPPTGEAASDHPLGPDALGRTSPTDPPAAPRHPRLSPHRFPRKALKPPNLRPPRSANATRSVCAPAAPAKAARAALAGARAAVGNRALPVKTSLSPIAAA